MFGNPTGRALRPRCWHLTLGELEQKLPGKLSYQENIHEEMPQPARVDTTRTLSTNTKGTR